MKKRFKAALGWLGIIILSFIPVFLWFRLGPGIQEFADYSSAVHSLGELFGLVGMTMFALTFVLSTRLRFIENIFGGLDKVYIVHGILGGTALIMILFHPIFLVLKFIPQDITQAAIYLLPSTFWSVNFGILALLGLIILIYITLFTKIKYHRWKFTHEFLGLVFALAVLHVFLVRGSVSSDYIFHGYYVYAAVVSAIGLGAFSYSLLLKERIMKAASYLISDIRKSRNTLVLELVPEHKPINYNAGQAVFIRFYNEHLSKESHPFSIASKTGDNKMRIMIKKLGDFTERLEHLKPGDRVSVEGPYGKFHFRNYPGKRQIWIAAGIGVTPFIGMAEDLLEKKHDIHVDLYYTARDDSDFAGYDIFSKVASEVPGFRFFPWNSSQKGRITVDSIEKTSSLKNAEFLLCGSHAFKESIIHKLIKSGVDKDNIHEEVFDFR